MSTRTLAILPVVLAVAAAPDTAHNLYPWTAPTTWDVTLVPKGAWADSARRAVEGRKR